MKTKTDVLYCGDCVDVMQARVLDESVDLVYADPPFFTQRDFGAFNDIFDDIEAYLQWLRPKLEECYRVLKSTGSIYVHLDWHAVHYVKVMMDEIFGYKRYTNEIIWHYPSGQCTKKGFGKKHDTIVCYSKSAKYIFNHDDILIPYTEKELARFNKTDADGRRFYWNGSRTAGKYKTYHTKKGKNPTDVWVISIAPDHERLGYPTQKPEALLERIIKASSNPGDIVLDPFSGCATCVSVAEKLGRRWIGIDVSPDAIEISEKRMCIS